MHLWQVYIEVGDEAAPVCDGACTEFREATRQVLETLENCASGRLAYGDISWTNVRDEPVALRVTRRVDGGIIWSVPS